MSSTHVIYGEPETRRRILEATWRLVEERGAALRLADVAERAGVSRQAVYLHFGDRSGLLVALVEYIDEVLGSGERIGRILAAPTGVEALERMVEALSTFTAGIDSVARVLEAAQFQDDALAAAWRNRMEGRRAISGEVVGRIAEEGRLRAGLTVETAADLLYAVTMPGLWRELVEERGWSTDEYAEHVAGLLRRALVE